MGHKSIYNAIPHQSISFGGQCWHAYNKIIGPNISAAKLQIELCEQIPIIVSIHLTEMHLEVPLVCSAHDLQLAASASEFLHWKKALDYKRILETNSLVFPNIHTPRKRRTICKPGAGTVEAEITKEIFHPPLCSLSMGLVMASMSLNLLTGVLASVNLLRLQTTWSSLSRLQPHHSPHRGGGALSWSAGTCVHMHVIGS